MAKILFFSENFVRNKADNHDNETNHDNVSSFVGVLWSVHFIPVYKAILQFCGRTH